MSDEIIRKAVITDLPYLEEIEQNAFSSDRLSTASLKRWIAAKNALLLVVEKDQRTVAYGLVILHHKGRVARLYSIAVNKEARGLGLSKKLLLRLEVQAGSLAYSMMRLEVAENNATAIGLYKSLAYQEFARYKAYYQDGQDALRMQKPLTQ